MEEFGCWDDAIHWWGLGCWVVLVWHYCQHRDITDPMYCCWWISLYQITMMTNRQQEPNGIASINECWDGVVWMTAMMRWSLADPISSPPNSKPPPLAPDGCLIDLGASFSSFDGVVLQTPRFQCSSLGWWHDGRFVGFVLLLVVGEFLVTEIL